MLRTSAEVEEDYVYNSTLTCDYCKAVIGIDVHRKFINPSHAARFRILVGRGEMAEAGRDFCSRECAIKWLKEQADD